MAGIQLAMHLRPNLHYGKINVKRVSNVVKNPRDAKRDARLRALRKQHAAALRERDDAAYNEQRYRKLMHSRTLAGLPPRSDVGSARQPPAGGARLAPGGARRARPQSAAPSSRSSHRSSHRSGSSRGRGRSRDRGRSPAPSTASATTSKSRSRSSRPQSARPWRPRKHAPKPHTEAALIHDIKQRNREEIANYQLGFEREMQAIRNDQAWEQHLADVARDVQTDQLQQIHSKLEAEERERERAAREHRRNVVQLQRVERALADKARFNKEKELRALQHQRDQINLRERLKHATDKEEARLRQTLRTLSHELTSLQSQGGGGGGGGSQRRPSSSHASLKIGAARRASTAPWLLGYDDPKTDERAQTMLLTAKKNEAASVESPGFTPVRSFARVNSRWYD